jgi:hypothetical protein
MRIRVVLLAFVAVSLVPLAYASGQATPETRRAAATRLPAGTWTGTVTPPGGQVFNVQYEVASTADSAAIVILGNGNRYPASSVRFESGSLRFSWQPGPTLECVLAPQPDGGFAGECGTPNPGRLVMIPPKKG